jgi:heme/copper-type cytochrome/quinol oxidase subunit 2
VRKKPKRSPKPSQQSLIAEYEALDRSVERRSTQMTVAASFIFPITLGIMTFSIIYRKELGMTYYLGSHFPNAFFPLIPNVIVVCIFYLFWFTSAKINDLCFDRIHEIEKELHIKGHGYIKERLESEKWWKSRRHAWHVIFILLIIAYSLTAWLLFITPL